jgi:uroporphyrinogen-III decarboxylase
MGVDVLNPIEPPPLGDITLKEAIEITGNGMGLEGNIEISSLLLGSEEEVRSLIRNTVIESRNSDRFILCLSAGYMEYIDPTPQYINNLILYITYGLECVMTLRN